MSLLSDVVRLVDGVAVLADIRTFSRNYAMDRGSDQRLRQVCGGVRDSGAGSTPIGFMGQVDLLFDPFRGIGREKFGTHRGALRRALFSAVSIPDLLALTASPALCLIPSFPAEKLPEVSFVRVPGVTPPNTRRPGQGCPTATNASHRSRGRVLSAVDAARCRVTGAQDELVPGFAGGGVPTGERLRTAGECSWPGRAAPYRRASSPSNRSGPLIAGRSARDCSG